MKDSTNRTITGLRVPAIGLQAGTVASVVDHRAIVDMRGHQYRLPYVGHRPHIGDSVVAALSDRGWLVIGAAS